jgi:hypothetical protein
MLLTEDRLKQVTRAAQLNVQTALDLIAIHSEKSVRGPQPRASLNPFTVLAAVGSWERFVADLISATTEADWKGPGGHKSKAGSHWPHAIDGHLTRLGLLPQRLSALWEAKVPTTGWSGVQPRGWRNILQGSPTDERQQLLDYLAETRRTRNAAAHYAHLQNALEAAHKGGQDGWYPWQSDAQSPSLQSGYARGVTAVYLQLVDCTAVIVARAQNWNAENYRLPEDWFYAESQTARFAGVQFWGGASLHRTKT